MPELPDIVVYIEALEKRILGQTLERVRVASPFLLRTADPPLSSVEGKTVMELGRMGKRICMGLEGELWLVLHLMIAGRLHWKKRGIKVSPPRGLAAFDFTNGSLLWTEAGSKKRASLHVVAEKPDCALLIRADWKFWTRISQPLRGSHLGQPRFEASARRPHLFSGIGNAYSDKFFQGSTRQRNASSRRRKSNGCSRLVRI